MLPDRPAVQALYDRVASQGHFALARRPEWWNQRLWGYPGDWVVYEGRRRGQIEGYLHYEADSAHGAFRLALTLIEFVAATPEAHRGLVGYLASLSDQVQEIHFAAPGDGAWTMLYETPQNLRPGPEIGIMTDTGNVAHGAMLRVTDVKLALEGFPVAQADGKAMTPSSADSSAVERNPRRTGDRPIDFLNGRVVIFLVFIFIFC